MSARASLFEFRRKPARRTTSVAAPAKAETVSAHSVYRVTLAPLPETARVRSTAKEEKFARPVERKTVLFQCDAPRPRARPESGTRSNRVGCSNRERV